MYILGIDCYGHDSAAALLKDGEIVAIAEEERFTREKHTTSFPINAMKYCLEEAGIEGSQLDMVGYYWDPSLGVGQRIWHILRYFPHSIELVRSRTKKDFFPMLKIRDLIWKSLNLDHADTRFEYVEHHLAHAASTFLVSPFEQAAILSIDAVGEWTSTWYGYGKKNRIYLLKEIGFPHSMGMLYGSVTEYLGFKFASGEGKVMGLAPYGKPIYINEFRKIVKLKPEGGFKLDLSYFDFHKKGRGHWVSKKFIEEFGPARTTEKATDPHYADIAASLQLMTEEVGLHCAEYLHKETGMDTICMAGGVALNSVMNGRILSEGPFKDIYIQPIANDAGTSLGTALVLHNKYGGERKAQMPHAYWGPSFEDAQIETVLKSKNIPYEKLNNAPEKTAELLAGGRIVGWFQGRMEVGPRALGNRSILADPRKAEMKDILNSRVKHRESFRPFAPSILEERVSDYFEVDYPSPFMILVYKVRPEKEHEVAAISHVDHTGRVQTVSRQYNPRYWNLIDEFRKITGVPVVLNTSFNIRGEPIVGSPEDAVSCFLGTGMDYLVLNDYLLDKSKMPEDLIWDSAPLAEKSEH
ncbi:carbamoyltransferase [bacterium]|nr:carbamoyltransferase [bacterium]